MELPVLPNEPTTQFLLKGDEEEEDEEEGLASVVYDMSKELFFRFFPRVMLLPPPLLLLLLVEEAALVVEWVRLAEGASLGLKDLLPPLVRGCLRGRPEARDGWCDEGIWGDEDTCRDCAP